MSLAYGDNSVFADRVTLTDGAYTFDSLDGLYSTGDFLVLAGVTNSGVADAWDLPDGWVVEYNASTGVQVWSHKVADGESITSLTVDMGSATSAYLILAQITGGGETVTVQTQGVLSGSPVTADAVTPTVDALALYLFAGRELDSTSYTATTPSGTTNIASVLLDGPGLGMLAYSKAVTAGTSSGTATTTISGGTVSFQPVTLMVEGNHPPSAPTGLIPSGGSSIGDSQDNTFTWTFHDQDPSDTQSAFDIRYRASGDEDWTTVSVTSSASSHVFAADTFTADDWEWQVRTTDAAGSTGDWSVSAFFTAAAPPDPPTLTNPTDGGTVNFFENATWTTDDTQQAYEIRRVADDDGTADDSTVYYDNVNISAIKVAALTFAVNDRDEHVQVRIMVGGIWSDWADAKVSVSWVGPPAATFTATGYDRPPVIVVDYDTPDAESSEDTPDYVDIYLSTDGGDTSERKATGLDLTGQWVYRFPASGVDYTVKVSVVGVGGIPTDSDWTGSLSWTAYDGRPDIVDALYADNFLDELIDGGGA